MSSARKLELVAARCALCGSGESEVCARGVDFEYDTSDDVFQMVSCLGCGHQYLNPRPASSQLDDIYPSNYYSFTGTSNRLVARLQRVWESGKVRLYRELVGDGERRLLDVGCGNGRLLSLLRDFGDERWELAGLEFDEGAVKQCRDIGFDVVSERVEDFAERDDQRGCYDAVIMLQLIEHVEDPALLCERVYTLLRPGGVFIIETPNLGGLDYRLFKGRWWGHYHFPRHWNLFSTDALVRMLETRGFEITRCEYLISTSSWIISHHNYAKDRDWPRFVQRFFNYQNPILLGLALVMDTLRTKLGLETSNQRVVGRKPAAAWEQNRPPPTEAAIPD
ncbi:MAG: class I SAM-dependent methyltransferase [Deltaproteobacteria bacterium]|nr:class I SAM-dependent methyltransferase [Deltaproteobacteria bacterium]